MRARSARQGASARSARQSASARSARRTRERRQAAALALACALSAAAGCASYTRGVLAAAATTMPRRPLEVVAADVTGRSCSELLDVRYERAVDDALARAPGATALIDVTSTWERFCVVVRGDAVRFLPEPEGAQDGESEGSRAAPEPPCGGP